MFHGVLNKLINHLFFFLYILHWSQSHKATNNGWSDAYNTVEWAIFNQTILDRRIIIFPHKDIQWNVVLSRDSPSLAAFAFCASVRSCLHLVTNSSLVSLSRVPPDCGRPPSLCSPLLAPSFLSCWHTSHHQECHVISYNYQDTITNWLIHQASWRTSIKGNISDNSAAHTPTPSSCQTEPTLIMCIKILIKKHKILVLLSYLISNHCNSNPNNWWRYY